MAVEGQAGRSGFCMEGRKLNYRFHNLNTAEDTAEFLYKIFLEVNSEKVEREIRKAANKIKQENYIEK